MTSRMPQMLYLVPNLADPATGRRVSMLRAGGAQVTLAGFRRSEDPVSEIAGIAPIDLGTTHDGKFLQRVAAVVGANLSVSSKFRNVRKPDVIVARNLEMLALAQRLNTRFGGSIPIAYECLDIHRLMLRDDSVGTAMRAAEQRLSRNVEMLITSSPAFLREYFEPRGHVDAPVMLLENKVLELAPRGLPAAAAKAPGEPWRIGWFGALRCRRSLGLLSAFTRAMDGRFEVVMRGLPAYSEFEDFDAQVSQEPFIRYEGPYRNPDDLADIYGEVDFSWAIDFFEEGQNSTWLLPNRLYEGCRHGAVPIALGDTETGRFLKARGMGLLLGKGALDDLAGLLENMNPASLIDQRARVEAAPNETWVCGIEECRDLVDRLQALASSDAASAPLEVAA